MEKWADSERPCLSQKKKKKNSVTAMLTCIDIIYGHFVVSFYILIYI